MASPPTRHLEPDALPVLLQAKKCGLFLVVVADIVEHPVVTRLINDHGKSPESFECQRIDV